MTSIAETLALLKGAKNQYSRNQGKTVQIKEGKTKVRILQGVDKKFWRDVGQHWIKPDESAKAVAVVGSRAATYDTDCAVGDAIDRAILGAVDDEQVKLYKSWRARKFVLVPALIFDGPNASPEPQILQLSSGPFHDFLSVAETYAESGVDVFSPTDGIDIVFERRGKMLDTEYTVMAAPVSKKFDPAILTRLPDLDAFIEKEYFRQGDDRKALVAISTITGISFTAPALAPPRAPTAGALTGNAAKLAELSSTVEPPAPTPRARVAPPVETIAEIVVEDEDERAMRELQDRMAAKKAAAAATAAAALVTTATATPPAANDIFGADLDMDDLDATLQELDGL